LNPKSEIQREQIVRKVTDQIRRIKRLNNNEMKMVKKKAYGI